MKLGDQMRVGWRLAAALRSQWWSAERIRAFQNRSVVSMMRHAVRHVPYYQRLRLDADKLCSIEDLQRFPILTKSDLQREGLALLANGVAVAGLPSSRTSGSTGEPTTTYFDPAAWLLTRYVLKMRRIVATTGFAPGHRILVVSESRPESLEALARAAPRAGDWLFQQKFVSIHDPVATHLEVIRSFRPTALYAYPSYLIELLTQAARGDELPAIPVIYTSSEVLTVGARSRIEAGLRGHVYDVYGSTEFKEVAWQCHYGTYHLNFESVYVEPLPLDTSAAITMTGIRNYAMPLLRYRVGDLARGIDGACGCGRASAVLATVDGRQGDMIHLPGGRNLSPYLLTTLIEADPQLLQYRIVQTAPAAFRIDRVRRQAVRDSAAHDESLRRELAAVLGDHTEVTLRDVPTLERSPGNKQCVFTRDASMPP
jgi:phenylacetate-CoA ligase